MKAAGSAVRSPSGGSPLCPPVHSPFVALFHTPTSSQSWLDFSRTQRVCPGASSDCSLCLQPLRHPTLHCLLLPDQECDSAVYLRHSGGRSAGPSWPFLIWDSEKGGEVDVVDGRVQLPLFRDEDPQAPRDPELAQVHTVSETLGPLAPSVVVCSLIHGAQDLSRPSRAVSLVGEVE